MQRRRSIKAKTVNLMLRLPPELHKRLIAAADACDPPLSLNRAIIWLLDQGLIEQGLKAAGYTPPPVRQLTPAEYDELDVLFNEWWARKHGGKKR